MSQKNLSDKDLGRCENSKLRKMCGKMPLSHCMHSQRRVGSLLRLQATEDTSARNWRLGNRNQAFGKIKGMFLDEDGQSLQRLKCPMCMS